MTGVVPRLTTAVWVLLVVVTVASFWVGTGHVGGTTVTAATVIGAGFGKAFLVGRHFMEIGGAPAPLRWAFTAWIWGFGALCLGLVVS